eukprot:2303234-Pyramimonas_sp.AAC.1
MELAMGPRSARGARQNLRGGHARTKQLGPGRRGLAQARAVPHSVGPTSSPPKWRQFPRSQPPKDGEVSFRPARCLAPLDPPAVFERSDNSQIAAPQGRGGLAQVRAVPHS